MTHTYIVSTNVGRVRLLIGDTDISPTTDAHFTDEEIEAFLSLASDSVYLASAMALEAWAGFITDTLVSEKIGDYSYSKREADGKLALAARYRTSEDYAPAIDWAEPDLIIGEND